MTKRTNRKDARNTEPESPTETCNAWLVRIGEKARLDKFSITIELDPSIFRGIREEDAVLAIEERNNTLHAILFGRIFRKRSTLTSTLLYFDGSVSLESPIPLDNLGTFSFPTDATTRRIEWPVFVNALKTACNLEWASFPVFQGATQHERAHVRALLELAVVDDLLGPAGGPNEEIIGMSVRDRYLLGKLAPIEPSGRPRIEGSGRETVDGEQEDLKPFEGNHQPGGEFSTTEGVVDTEGDETQDVDASRNQSVVPSSLGFTFCVDATVKNLVLTVHWGRYERLYEHERFVERRRRNPETGISETISVKAKVWRRIPSGGSLIFDLKKKNINPIAIDENCPQVVIKGSIGQSLEKGDRLVTLFLINAQTAPEQNKDQAWLFQPELIVRDRDDRPIFRRKPLLHTDNFDKERKALEMLYREHAEFAVGHGVSVHAIPSEEDRSKAIEVRTVVMPQYDIPVTETPGLDESDREAMRRLVHDGFLDMKTLAELDRTELVTALKILTDDYAQWIKEHEKTAEGGVAGHNDSASEAVDRCGQISKRLEEGIAVLESNDQALEAFRFANRSMALQRVRGIYALSRRRGEESDVESFDVPKNRSWRSFQLAFILLSIPSLADPCHRDRTEPLAAYADLLWFPTGGGKTEAYLGVAAFTMGIRRLQGDLGGLDARRGLAVIMRYTLRLLTLQQFQRATTLICAMEALRRDDTEKWGTEPFTIGLWVGQKVTPNTTEEAHAAIQAYRDKKRHGSGSPAQLTSCPWCGSEIAEGRDIDVKRFKRDVGRTFIYCGDKLGRCEFSRSHANRFGLPVLVVDEEIYRHPPSMLIATVDKFAMMTWRGQVRTLFGRANRRCERHGLLWPEAECTGNHQRTKSLPATTMRSIKPIRPPDLVIQDEFHLIGGPLGTMVGLYETAVDELSSWAIDDKKIRPKIVASTATVRKADEQVNNVFLRQVSVFPPHGLDVKDNFFSLQRSIQKRPGRRYLGICSPGSSRPAVLIRVYVALLTAAQTLFERFGEVADPYMTVVGYFNSLRELGGMRRLAEDDVQTRSYRVNMSDVARPGLSQRAVKIVEELTSRVTSKEIPRKLDQLEVKCKSSWKKGETRAIDIVLATNMLSVGVDVNRLGLMVVNGQPKNTAEYIQATSRVGRFYPGLICTVLTWSRPRDLSHYETFEHYHATFYKHVEAQSVTPFAPRALDRGLTGTMVSMLRLGHEELNHNQGAQRLDNTTKSSVEETRQLISDRAWKVKNRAAKDHAEDMVADRVDQWVKEAVRPGRKLGYERERRQGDVAPLLKKPGIQSWDEFTAPMSMREVEPGVKLIMDVAKLSDPPDWRPKPVEEDGGGS